MLKKEVLSCLLCHDAPCSKKCKKFDIARIIRALRFDNSDIACKLLPDNYDKKNLKEAENVCPVHINIVNIFDELKTIKNNVELVDNVNEIDLSCDICGIKLENPFILSSSVVSSNYEMCARAFDMGWAGAAYKTISLMDSHEASPRFSVNKFYNGDWYGFKNIEQTSDHSIDENLDIFNKLKKNYPTKVIIASIMGRNENEWEFLAKKVTEAGADIIECNFSCPHMSEAGVGSDVGQNPELCKKYIKAVKKETNVPIIAKMTPNIEDIRKPAIASIEGGANGIAAINTIKSITGVNIDTQVALPSVHGQSIIGGYSGPAVKPIALKFIAELASDEKIRKYHISAMGGITTWKDAVEFLLLGANSIQITTAVMQYGYRIIDDLISGLKNYMSQRNYKNISEFVGAGITSLVNNDIIEKDTYVFPIFEIQNCIGCGRCFISCRDGGHQAIIFDEKTRKPKLEGKKCVGCQLCSLVCPVSAIKQSKRVDKKHISCKTR